MIHRFQANSVLFHSHCCWCRVNVYKAQTMFNSFQYLLEPHKQYGYQIILNVRLLYMLDRLKINSETCNFRHLNLHKNSFKKFTIKIIKHFSMWALMLFITLSSIASEIFTTSCRICPISGSVFSSSIHQHLLWNISIIWK